MHATILGLAQEEIADPGIESDLDGSTPAIDATRYETLDRNSSVYGGTAAGRVEYETDRVYVVEDAIHTEPELETETVACEFVADLDAGWVGVGTSDGEWLFSALGAEKGTLIHRAVIDVDGFAEYLSDYPSADAWMVTQSRSLDPDDDAEEATIDYHDAAHLSDTGNSRVTKGVGFEYSWSEAYVRGVVYESGYIAAFSEDHTPTYAAFINSEILPFAELPEEFQTMIGDARDETEGEADV